MDLCNLSTDLEHLADAVQNKTVEACAQIARAYGAPEEAVQAILRLKCKERDAA